MRLAGAQRWTHAVRWIHAHHGIGPLALLREYRRFRDAIAVNRVEFLYYWLWDVRRPLEDRMTIFSDREHYLVDRRINPPDATSRVREKAWATARLQEVGVPTAEVVALIAVGGDPEAVVPGTPVVRDRESAVALLRDAPPEGIVLKPVRGRGGEGVHVFRSAGPEGLVHLDGTPWTVDQWVERLGADTTWKVERRIVAHPVLAPVGGESLGTLRLVTIRLLDGTAHLCQPVWKVPIGRSGLDHFNYGVGSIAAEVDGQTGVVGRARRWEALEHTERHPETGLRIAGVCMPHWSATVDCALQAAAAFPDMGTLGLDVAITASGPVVIEVNTNWGQNLTQAPGPTGLVRGVFRRFLEERGCGDVVNLAARGGGPRPT